MTQNESNPLGINGVEFVEFSGPAREHFQKLFISYGFKLVSENQQKAWQLFRQGDINFVLNCVPGTAATEFSQIHGPCVSAMGFRFENAEKAFRLAVERGARPFNGSNDQKGPFPFPAVYGIGDSLVYFVDAQSSRKLYTEIFPVATDDQAPAGFGFEVIDHFTNNVPVGKMDYWADFYTKIFGFREVRYFDIRGAKTGLLSKVMRSPCGLFSIPINEPTDPKSQIQEYLDEYKGSGVQHVALKAKDIVQSLKMVREGKNEFLSTPPEAYYRSLKERLPGVTENVEVLKQNGILVDGDDKGYLLQIFSKNIIGPIFFELIQRKNHSGFGEGNFQALFDAIEQDQRERGYLK